MFFIFGWNHTKITEYGPVQEEECRNCHNKDIWQLKKISKYFTLFFIPIFPHDSEDLYHCPICNYGLRLDKEDFESYKKIAQLNVDCLEKTITEEQREIKLQEIKKEILERNEEQNSKNVQNSHKWNELVSEKSTEELELILNQKREEYNPAFIIAAESELSKRKNKV